MSNNRANVTVFKEQVDSNYEIAQRYYEILKERTFNYLATQVGTKVDTKIEEILTEISKYWTEKNGYQEATRQALRDALQSKNNSVSVDGKAGKMEFNITLPKDSTKAVTEKDIESKIGFIYEQFATQIFQSKLQFGNKIIAHTE